MLALLTFNLSFKFLLTVMMLSCCDAWLPVYRKHWVYVCVYVCARIHARVYCTLYVRCRRKKVHVRYLIFWWDSFCCKHKALFFRAAWNASADSSYEKAVCLSVRLSVCVSNAWIVTTRKKDLSNFLYHTKDHLAHFSEKKNGWCGPPLLPEILGRTDPVWANSPIFSRYLLVAPQR